MKGRREEPVCSARAGRPVSAELEACGIAVLCVFGRAGGAPAPAASTSWDAETRTRRGERLIGRRRRSWQRWTSYSASALYPAASGRKRRSRSSAVLRAGAWLPRASLGLDVVEQPRCRELTCWGCKPAKELPADGREGDCPPPADWLAQRRRDSNGSLGGLGVVEDLRECDHDASGGVLEGGADKGARLRSGGAGGGVVGEVQVQ